MAGIFGCREPRDFFQKGVQWWRRPPGDNDRRHFAGAVLSRASKPVIAWLMPSAFQRGRQRRFNRWRQLHEASRGVEGQAGLRCNDLKRSLPTGVLGL